MDESPMVDPDFSNLVRATNINDYTSAITWIERNKHYLSSKRYGNQSYHQVVSQISRILRDAAVHGQVTRVDFLRHHG